MPDTKPTSKAPKRKKAKPPPKAKATAKPKAGARTSKAKASKAAGSSRTAQSRSRPGALPREVLKSLEEGQRTAVDAMRKFMDTVDSAMPRRVESARHRQEIVDSALEMAERLVQAQYDFLRRVAQSASRTFGDSVKRN